MAGVLVARSIAERAKAMFDRVVADGYAVALAAIATFKPGAAMIIVPRFGTRIAAGDNILLVSPAKVTTSPASTYPSRRGHGDDSCADSEPGVVEVVASCRFPLYGS